MAWYIAILLTVYSPEQQDRLHIIFEPYFQTYEECYAFTESQEGSEYIINHLFEEYGSNWALKNLYCGSEKAVLEAMGVKYIET